MTVERLDTLAQFHQLRADWDTLYRCDPEAQFFLSWQWLAGVFDTYPGEWLVLVARGTDGACLGLLPLQLKTVWSQSREQLRNELHFAGRLFWADYGGILCRPAHEAAVLRAFACHLKQMNWSHLYLKNFRVSDTRFAFFMEPFDDERLTVEFLSSEINRGETDNLVCPNVELPGTFEAFLTEKLSSNTRQKIRRLLRRLESSPDYRITATTVETQARDLHILEALWSKMWAPLKGSDTPRLSMKYRMIVKRGLDDDLLYMPVLWHGKTAVGVLASFLDRDKSRMLFFVGGRDEDHDEVPVGLLLHVHSIRWAIEQGMRTYDFLRGNESYKYSLGAADERLKYPLIRAKSGTNLNGKLDAGSLDDALRLARDLARRSSNKEAATACRQILATSPAEYRATELLRAMATQ